MLVCPSCKVHFSAERQCYLGKALNAVSKAATKAELKGDVYVQTELWEEQALEFLVSLVSHHSCDAISVVVE